MAERYCFYGMIWVTRGGNNELFVVSGFGVRSDVQFYILNADICVQEWYAGISYFQCEFQSGMDIVYPGPKF